MWRLHWRRAIFYSAITKRQHVSPPCARVTRAHTHTRRRCITRALCTRIAPYAYLLTGALFANNDEEACDDDDADPEVPATDLF